MQILVTGSSGFFGTHLCRYLSSKDEVDCFTLDRTAPYQGGDPDRALLLGEAPPSRENIRELLSDRRFDAIVHGAAMSSFGGCEEDPQAAELANIEYTRGLAEYAKGNGSYLAFISTDLVFDGNSPPEAGGFSEEDRPDPCSVYASTKRRAEEVVTEFLSDSSVVLRTSLLYGLPAGRGGGPLRWLLRALQEGKEVTLFSDEWRTPLLVGDLVQIVVACLEKRPTGFLHCSGADRVSRVEFGRAVATAWNKELLLQERSRSTAGGPARPEDVSLSNKRVQRQLGVVPSGVVEGLSSLFASGAPISLE